MLECCFLDRGRLTGYVDFHSFFFSALPDMLTYLGEVLKWLGISFKYAPTAQAKGKVERQHLFWQNRLPAYFAAERIGQIDQANVHIDELRTHHNEQEIHREIGMTRIRRVRVTGTKRKAGPGVVRAREIGPSGQ